MYITLNYKHYRYKELFSMCGPTSALSVLSQRQVSSFKSVAETIPGVTNLARHMPYREEPKATDPCSTVLFVKGVK